MYKNWILCASLLCGLSAVAQSTSAASVDPKACSKLTLGVNGALNGFIPSEHDVWHQDISAAPVDPNSDKITSRPENLGGAHLHPDFSSTAGGFGIPYIVADSAEAPMTPVQVSLYPDDSDLSYMPLPKGVLLEGGDIGCKNPDSDHHAIVIDRKTCVVYELWNAGVCRGEWKANGEAMWDMLGIEQRPMGLSSVDAAGLSVFEGLLRYDEIASGEIKHALRFTTTTKKNEGTGYFTPPATHPAGLKPNTDNIMGMRIRLKADFDISHFSPTNQIILKAMKKYGMILADNGSNLFFQGTMDSHWNDDDLHRLTTITAAAFEVVKMGTVYDRGTMPTGDGPTITSFTPSATTVAAGTPVVLTAVIENGSYAFVDKEGFMRGPMTVTPTETTTYKLTARNGFGTATASATVTVNGKKK